MELARGLGVYAVMVGLIAAVNHWYGPSAGFFVMVSIGIGTAMYEQTKA